MPITFSLASLEGTSLLPLGTFPPLLMYLTAPINVPSLLPLGVRLNNQTGALEGTPEALLEQTPFVINASNAVGVSALPVVVKVPINVPFHPY